LLITAMYSRLQQVVAKIDFASISDERKELLSELRIFIQEKKSEGLSIQLNFVCTHNSRRSQLAQIWAAVAAQYYRVNVNAFSSGVEVTRFNEAAVNSLKQFGFEISADGKENPQYEVRFGDDITPVISFSKLIDHPINPSDNFAAIMTCTDADENCPIVFGCDKRISLPYEDPKKFDGTPLETAMYDYRSFQIATELFYVFSLIR